MKDHREYVRVAVDLPENPKLVGLSASAKWLYIVALCYAGRHLTDGHVPLQVVLRTASAKPSGSAVLVTRNILHEPGHECKNCDQPEPGWLVIHDYLDHQRSRSDADAARRAGKAGAQGRWGAKGNAKRNADGNADGIYGSHAKGNANPNAEVEVEVERVIGSQSVLDRTADATSDRLDLDRIRQALGQGTTTTRARHVADTILAKAPRPPGNPTAYVVSAITAAPHLYRQTSGPPALNDLCDTHGRARDTCPTAWHEEVRA